MSESSQDIVLFTAKDVSKLLRCSVPLIYKMAERKQLKVIRWECPGEGDKKSKTMVRFKKSDILDFIEKNYQTDD